jgi:hypothetical protein
VTSLRVFIVLVLKHVLSEAFGGGKLTEADQASKRLLNIRGQSCQFLRSDSGVVALACDEWFQVSQLLILDCRFILLKIDSRPRACGVLALKPQGGTPNHFRCSVYPNLAQPSLSSFPFNHSHPIIPTAFASTPSLPCRLLGITSIHSFTRIML